MVLGGWQSHVMCRVNPHGDMMSWRQTYSLRPGTEEKEKQWVGRVPTDDQILAMAADRDSWR